MKTKRKYEGGSEEADDSDELHEEIVDDDMNSTANLIIFQ